MKQTALLTPCSLLSILFLTLHMAGDILFQLSPPGLINLIVVLIVVVQLYGTLVLSGRRSGYLIVLFLSLLELAVPIVHMKGAKGMLGGDFGVSAQAFVFLWATLALSATAAFSVILAASALLTKKGEAGRPPL